MDPNPLRALPSVNELLDSPQLKALLSRQGQRAVAQKVRAILDDVRQELMAAASGARVPNVSELAERVARHVAAAGPSMLAPAINASGLLLHPALAQPPLPEAAIADLVAVARDYTLCQPPASGTADRSSDAVESLACELTGAESALVVNHRAAALFLAAAALSAQRELIVARGHLIESRGVRVSEIVAAAGARLREVGAVNSVRLDDYASAIGPDTGAILTVRAPNVAFEGEHQQVDLPALAQLAHRHQLPLICVCGSAALIDLTAAGCSDEPLPGQLLRQGADLVLLPTDDLIGGPQAALLLGRQPVIRELLGHSLGPALYPSALTLAALAATLRCYQQPGDDAPPIPLLALLQTSLDNLEQRARRLAPQIAAAPGIRMAEPRESTAFLGPAELSHRRLRSWSIAIDHATLAPHELLERLRTATPPVVARLTDGRVQFDLRGVIPRHDVALVDAVTRVANPTS